MTIWSNPLPLPKRHMIFERSLTVLRVKLPAYTTL